MSDYDPMEPVDVDIDAMIDEDQELYGIEEEYMEQPPDEELGDTGQRSKQAVGNEGGAQGFDKAPQAKTLVRETHRVEDMTTHELERARARRSAEKVIHCVSVCMCTRIYPSSHNYTGSNSNPNRNSYFHPHQVLSAGQETSSKVNGVSPLLSAAFATKNEGVSSIDASAFLQSRCEEGESHAACVLADGSRFFLRRRPLTAQLEEHRTRSSIDEISQVTGLLSRPWAELVHQAEIKQADRDVRTSLPIIRFPPYTPSWRCPPVFLPLFALTSKIIILSHPTA